ncbi:hypothetical protein HPP92_023870 [Vanilla planifolia]|uniref:Uncharacterized protein n=1 Tax=Vanilla planifolia TaxID=51239 RepID=A0A835PNM1_VANPL|nr:hypothetical protein HPP92_023870 [Vanilla planifolia]
MERRKLETSVRSKASSLVGLMWEVKGPSCERRCMRLRRRQDFMGGHGEGGTVVGDRGGSVVAVDGVNDGELDGSFQAHRFHEAEGFLY